MLCDDNGDYFCDEDDGDEDILPPPLIPKEDDCDLDILPPPLSVCNSSATLTETGSASSTTFSRVLFSKNSDLWETPAAVFRDLDDEFHFDLDAAALRESAKCGEYLGPDHEDPKKRDALRCAWGQRGWRVWLNPPYSRCREFVAKAHEWSRRGRTVVCFIPSRTDTRWYHEYLWDAENHRFRPGVQIRFFKGRVKFGSSKNSAPFPSMAVVFEGTVDG